MKTVIFSFDDGRLDTYEYAYKAMKKYDIPGCVFIASGFVLDNSICKDLDIKCEYSLTPDKIIELYNHGWEIGCHGRYHSNRLQDLADNIKDLEELGVETKNIGFASPFSEITFDNNPFFKHIKKGTLLYVRSGIQTRREGILYIAFSLFNSVFHLNKIYCKLNRKCIIHSPSDFYLSVGISKNNTVHEIISLVNDEMQDGDTVILNFHSILPKKHKEFGVDRWSFDLVKFEKLLAELKTDEDITFMTIKGYTIKGI